MSVEENKDLFQRTYEELLNRGSLDVADELIAAEFINHEAPPGRDRGPESMRGLATMLRTAFPELHFEIEELVAEGDTVAGRPLDDERHSRRAVDGHAPDRALGTSRPHALRTLSDGKAVEHWGVRDDLGMMQQLGVIPDPGQPGDSEPR